MKNPSSNNSIPGNRIMLREVNISIVSSDEFGEGEVNTKVYVADTVTVEYEHGNMTQLKKDIKEAFKIAKKELDI